MNNWDKLKMDLVTKKYLNGVTKKSQKTIIERKLKLLSWPLVSPLPLCQKINK